MINPAIILKLQGLKKRFVNDHPKFPSFLNAIHKKGLSEGTIITIEIKAPDGERMSSNLKLNASDIAAYSELMQQTQSIK